MGMVCADLGSKDPARALDQDTGTCRHPRSAGRRNATHSADPSGGAGHGARRLRTPKNFAVATYPAPPPQVVRFSWKVQPSGLAATARGPNAYWIANDVHPSVIGKGSRLHYCRGLDGE